MKIPKDNKDNKEQRESIFSKLPTRPSIKIKLDKRSSGKNLPTQPGSNQNSNNKKIIKESSKKSISKQNSVKFDNKEHVKKEEDVKNLAQDFLNAQNEDVVKCSKFKMNTSKSYILLLYLVKLLNLKW